MTKKISDDSNVEGIDQKMYHIDVPFEIKASDDDDKDFFTFEGFASTFGNIDLVDDIIEPGAFTESIAKQLPVLLWQHDSWEPIGMPSEVAENAAGLFLKGVLPKSDTFVTGRVIPQIKIGSIKAMSIGFRIQSFRFEERDGDQIRIIEKVKLHEVSLVTFPANEMAVITGHKRHDQFHNSEAVKSMTKRDLEKALRKSGSFSKDAAILIVRNFHPENSSDSNDQGTEQGEPAGEDVEEKEALQAMLDKLESIKRGSEINSITKKVSRYVRTERTSDAD